MRRLAAILSLCLMCGCAARPSAELGWINQPSDLTGKEIDTYAFPQTMVDTQRSSDGDLTVTARNTSFPDFRVGVKHHDAIGVKTNLNISKIDNSDLVDQAGVEVVDNRVKLIEEAGKVVVSAAKLAAFSADGATPQDVTTIDTSALESSLPRGGSGASAMPDQWPQYGAVRIWFGPIEPDAVSVGSDLSKLRSGLIYSGCRELRVYAPHLDAQGGGLPMPAVQKSVFVADPHYYRFVAFPTKGNVKFHSQCGVSVTSDKDPGTTSDAAVLSALLDQIKSVQEQLSSKKDTSEPSQTGVPNQ